MTFIKKILPNGLRVLLVPVKGSETVTVSTTVEAGSNYEDKGNNGISHFLEHMCFKGTPTRPSSSIINHELDAIGSQSNAFTGNEWTSYYAKAHFRHLPKILDIISDLYLNPLLPEAEIEKEKGVVIEEINMYEDIPQRKVWDVYAELLHKNEPAGRPIIGPKENIRSLTRKDLISYRSTHYVPSTTTVVVSGKFNQSAVMKQISNTFGKMKKSKALGKVTPKNIQKNPAVSLLDKKSDQSHLILGFRAFDLYDKRNWALSLLSVILGGGMSSRLFQKMREELGICYYVRSGKNAYTTHGDFAISAGVANDRLEEALVGIIEELNKLKTDKVLERELRKAKDYQIGNLFLGLEGSDDFAEFYGFQEISHEKIMTPAECVKKIEAVTIKDIQDMAKKIFDKKHANLAIVGPKKDDKNLIKLLGKI